MAFAAVSLWIVPSAVRSKYFTGGAVTSGLSYLGEEDGDGANVGTVVGTFVGAFVGAFVGTFVGGSELLMTGVSDGSLPGAVGVTSGMDGFVSVGTDGVCIDEFGVSVGVTPLGPDGASG